MPTSARSPRADSTVTHAVGQRQPHAGRVDGAAGLLRTKLQHHYQDIGLLFAGSEPSTMRLLFTGVDQPFYGQADLVDVPGLDLLSLIDIIDRGFDGRPPAGLAARIHRFTDGHPQRSMQIADAAWLVVSSAPTSDPDEVWLSAQNARDHLIAQGQLTQATMRVSLIDPLYEDWVRNRFST